MKRNTRHTTLSGFKGQTGRGTIYVPSVLDVMYMMGHNNENANSYEKMQVQSREDKRKETSPFCSLAAAQDLSNKTAEMLFFK